MTTGTVNRVPEDVTRSQELAVQTDSTVALAREAEAEGIIRLN